MSLFDDAHSDYQEIMRSDMGASRTCNITSPEGIVKPFLCRGADISQRIDPGTNEAVSGRQVTVSLLLSDLDDAGFSGIRGIVDSSSRPWQVTIADILGNVETYKVIESNPDSTLGSMVVYLEKYGGGS